jgi:hypothetical protein
MKAGQHVRCIADGGKEYQLMFRKRNRLKYGTIYKIKSIDEVLGEIRLYNKATSWPMSMFKVVTDW